MEEDPKDTDYVERKSTPKKNQRPGFKTKAYARIARRMGTDLVACNGTEPPIQGRKPVYKFLSAGQWVYLTKDYEEMRTDRVHTKWKKIDKDHVVDYIALAVSARTMSTQGNVKPAVLDLAFFLAARSSKNLRFLPRSQHKKKRTYRTGTIPKTLKNRADAIMSRKLNKVTSRKGTAAFSKYRKHYSRLKRNAPSWSLENQFE